MFFSALMVAAGQQGALVTSPADRAAESIAALGGMVSPDEIHVKFRDGAGLRVKGGRVVNAPEGLGLGALLMQGAGWSRAHHVDDATLETLRRNAERALGVALPDLTQEARLRLPAGVEVAEALGAMMALDVVEYASAVPLPPELPLPGNYEPDQGYLFASPGGMNDAAVWEWIGGTGDRVAICDIEYSWNRNHGDLPGVTVIGPTPGDPFNNTDHGTAVLGEMISIPNGWGTTGGAHGAAGRVAGAHTNGSYRLNAAITAAAAALSPGDLILIEQQIWGPTGDYVPSEWVRSVYDAIRVAVGNGIIVVEAAGNGGQNLDGGLFSVGNGGHWPFLPQNDSGAIIVGAGVAPAGGLDRSRLGFSCYGSTVDLQGWGHLVVTTGYGDRYSSEGGNLLYTSNFGGTSSASPTVTNACAVVASVAEAVLGHPLTPAQVRDALRATGSPQQGPTQNIGPRPDALAALWSLFPEDCDGNSRPDAIDIAMGAPDSDGDGVPDACEPCKADLSGSSDPRDPEYGVPDGTTDGADFFYYIDQFAAGVVSAADLSGSTDPSDPMYGAPDGVLDASDFFYYLDLFVAGCP